ncbi:MAG: histidine--tRNA ligase [Thermodesulfobacteriota bacterium]
MGTIHKITGFQDLIEKQAQAYTYMEDQARRVFSRYGFQEIRIPVLERTELFARSIGQDTDVVQKEMYTFQDRKGRSLTLRPEATAGVVRAYIENKLYSRESVSKLFTLGPMFRYERPQKGRSRQFHQVNAELLGSSAPQADAEIILMLWSYLQELHLPGLKLELNSLGCRDCRPVYSQRLGEFLQGTNQNELCQDCRSRMHKNPLRLFDCKQQACARALEQAPFIADHLCSGCQEHYHSVQKILQQVGVPFTQNKNLVRGLDYYQRTAFEVTSQGIGAQTSVAGGGRYDSLVRELGGPDVPGIGFACGMERLALLLPEQEATQPDFYLAVLEEQALSLGQELAQRLRSQGLGGQVSLEAKSPKSQLRTAHKLQARKCLLLGEEEINAQALQVKDMQSGEQESVDLTQPEQAFR